MRFLNSPTNRSLAAVIGVLLCLNLGMGSARAQDEVYQKSMASIYGNKLTEAGTNNLANTVNGSFQNFQGVAALNQASGTLNSQANLLAVTMGSGGGLQLNGSGLSSQVRNNTLTLAPGASSNYSAIIGGQSFWGGSGIAMLNQVSGNMNVQLSQVGLNIGAGAVTALSSQQLSAISAHNRVNIPAGAAMNAKVKLDDGAFQNFTGVANVSQVAGNLNQVMTAININVR